MSSILHNLRGNATCPAHRTLGGSASACHTPQSKGPHNGGFALVIALSLMAFVLLLLLSITTLVQVETQSAGMQKDKLQAQQNALLGLKLALGDLQKFSGADQRITSSASIFDTDASTVDIDGVEHPNWVGVWDSDPALPHLNDRLDTNDAYYNYDERRDGSDNRFLGWLVSGNQDDIDNHDGNEIDPEDEVLIFGSDFGQLNAAEQAANQVHVKKVSITAGSANAGNYAYWVGDENQKALVDTYSTELPTASPADTERSRFTINQRSGTETLDAAGGLFDFVTDPSLATQLGLIQRPESLALLANTPEALRKEVHLRSHALSSVSTGLLTNPYTSGLKTDLSALLHASDLDAELNRGVPHSTDSDSRVVLAKYPNGSANHPSPAAPTWAQLQSWAQLADRGEGEALLARKHEDDAHGIYPVVTRYRLKLFPTVVADPALGDTLDLYFEPIVVLTNPYNSPLRLGNEMWVQLYFEKYYKTTSPSNDFDRGLNVSGRFYKWPLSRSSYYVITFGWNGHYGDNYWGNQNYLAYTDPSDIEYRGLNFKLPDITLEPGEVMSFGIANDGELYNGANLLAEGAFETGTTSQVILQHQDANGDPLRAPVDWSQVDQFENPAPKKTVPQAAVDIPVVNRFNRLLTCLNPKTGGQITRSIQPFRAAIALSDRATPTQAEHFYSFAGGIEVANPGIIQRHYFNRSDQGAQYAGSGNFPMAGGLYDPDSMQARSIFFDIALGAGFEAQSNRIELSGSPLATHGYRINHRWIDGHNFRAPQHFVSAADSQYQAPNTLYGGLAVYGHSQNNTISSRWPNFELAKIRLDGNGRSYWGTGIESDVGGLTRTTFFEAPSPELGLLSLGQLQHMLISETSSSDLYGIGGGTAYLKLGDTGNVSLSTGFGTGLDGPAVGSSSVVDQSFLINNALWDNFVFSGLPDNVNPAELATWNSVPLNDRYVLGESATVADLADPLAATKHISVKGAFNINSTQKEAWKAVLSGGNGLSIDAFGNGSEVQRSPINRYSTPLAGSGATYDEIISGYRQLNDQELDDLAGAIVQQVKTRGPFLSLGDFINRRVETDNTAAGLRSALETAIDASGINAGLIRSEDEPLDSFIEANLPLGSIRPPLHIEEVFEGPLATAVSQWITQADLLQKIAPFLNARSDTFIIRGYGDATDPISDKIRAHATCEAVIQRTYEYIDPATNQAEDAAYSFDPAAEIFEQGALSPENRRFGRRFNIVSFRWL
jgi:flagellar motor protein MotB